MPCGAAPTPGSGQGSGGEGSGADSEVRFWKVLVQSLGEVPGDSVVDTW